MQYNVRSNIDQVRKAMLSQGKQASFALSQAINDTTKVLQPALQAEMTRVFDRPTRYILRSPWRELATKSNVVGRVYLRYPGGKGIDPSRVLEAQVEGGSRHLKGSERALQRVGILPSGYYIVPGKGAKLDAFGNVPGSFLVQIISYFAAAGEQGYRANMTDKRKKALAKNRRDKATGFKKINGVQYFATMGKLRDGRGAHLAPGIYARRGTHGSDITPVLMFVRKPTYAKRLDFYGLADRVVRAELPAAFNTRYAAALATANP